MAALDGRVEMSWRGWRLGLWALVGVATIALAGLGGFVLGRQQQNAAARLPVLGAAPSYTMTNQLGQSVTAAAFRGKVQLVTFLFPYCTTMCPLIAAHLANLEHLGLRPAGIADKVAIVSFNVDPAHTGPAEMRAFLSQYGWKPDDLHWQYLTGPAAQVRRVVQQGFHVWYKRVSRDAETTDDGGFPMVQPEIVNRLAAQVHPDYDIVHNDVLEIVDRQGRIRKIYDNADTLSWTEILPIVSSLVR